MDCITSSTSARVPKEELALREIDPRGALLVLPPSAAPERALAERFIEKRFLDGFGSVIRDHYPTLLSLQNPDGSVAAALGIRDASEEPLFLEQYFDEPIEKAIAQAVGIAPLRSEILEIGNMASAGRSASARLVVASSFYLRSCRYRYAVVTATHRLRQMLDSFGFTWHALGPARAERLSDLGRSWGRYYAQSPQILIGEIKQSSGRMRTFVRPQIEVVQ
jgi:Thermostable hemolysin